MSDRRDDVSQGMAASDAEKLKDFPLFKQLLATGQKLDTNLVRQAGWDEEFLARFMKALEYAKGKNTNLQQDLATGLGATPTVEPTTGDTIIEVPAR